MFADTTPIVLERNSLKYPDKEMLRKLMPRADGPFGFNCAQQHTVITHESGVLNSISANQESRQAASNRKVSEGKEESPNGGGVAAIGNNHEEFQD